MAPDTIQYRLPGDDPEEIRNETPRELYASMMEDHAKLSLSGTAKSSLNDVVSFATRAGILVTEGLLVLDESKL